MFLFWFLLSLLPIQLVGQYVVSTFAGSTSGEVNGMGTNSKFRNPWGVSLAVDSSFALVAENSNHIIRKIIMSTAEVVYFVGSTTGNLDGIGTNTKLSNPRDVKLSFDMSYALVADYGNNLIRKIIVSTLELSTIAGQTSSGSTNGRGTNAQFNNPIAIVISPDQNYALVTDSGNHQIRKLIISTSDVSLLVGLTSGNINGIGTNTRFNKPYSSTFSSDGVYALVSEYNSNQIRKIVISTTEVTTLAGQTTAGTTNGIGTNAQFNNPTGLQMSIDDSYVIITDYTSDQIRTLTLSTLQVNLVAGSSSGNANGVGTDALFNAPTGISMSSDGTYILIGDYSGNQIRLMTLPLLPTVSPTSRPSISPSNFPSSIPTLSPTRAPTVLPTFAPSPLPSFKPSTNPTFSPTFKPSTLPTFTPSTNPSNIPTTSPSFTPSNNPTLSPSVLPSFNPTSPPTFIPSAKPSSAPSLNPSFTPSTNPTIIPSNIPTFTPSSNPSYSPSRIPSIAPTFTPSTSPTFNPSSSPTFNPSVPPSNIPSVNPSTSPTFTPSVDPTFNPSSPPTFNPSSSPSSSPTFQPSTSPTFIPSTNPSFIPSSSPTFSPSNSPTFNPSSSPTFQPSNSPTFIPSSNPSFSPSTIPSSNPTFVPSSSPTLSPTLYCDIRVSIVGDESRNILTTSSLTLQSNLIDCKGSNVVVDVRDVSYLWSIIDITTNKTIDSNLESLLVSLTGDKIKIPSFVLKPKLFYKVKVNVKVKININSNINSITSSSSSFVNIRVSQSSLVSRISGGSSQMVNKGEDYLLDGSESYDPDISSIESLSSYLSSEWSCININNSSLNCLISISSDGFKATISPSSLSDIGSVYLVKLRIKDKTNSSRTSESSVYLTISPPKSPKITISNNNNNNNINKNNKINSQDSLLLIGRIESFIPNTEVMWSVDDSNTNSILNSISQTPIKSSSLIVGVNEFKLLISGGSLLWKSTPYIFSLSTITSTRVFSSISISINRPPQSGVIVSEPLIGSVMNTKFYLSASGWEDEDIPLSYEFFYLSNGRNILRRQSEVSFVESMLPLGSSSNNNELDCWVRVYDSLNGISSSKISLVVNMISSSSSSSSSLLEVLKTSTSLLTITNNNNNNNNLIKTENIIQSVSLLSSVLNWKNCSLVPKSYCSSLNREECSSTRNTCGKCLSGYLGVFGDDNSLCVNENIYKSIQMNNNNNNNNECLSDSNCLEWESCVSNVCKMKNKDCKDSSCSNHGVCVLINSESSDKVSSCGVFENGCEAVCVCNEGYLGDVCEVSESEMSIFREIRSQMIIGLSKVVNEEINTNTISNGVVSESNVLSMFSSISSVSSSSWELSSESSNLLMEVLSKSLNGAESLDLSYESMSDEIFNSLESVGLFYIQSSSSLSSSLSSPSNYSNSSSNLFLSLLNNFTEYISNQFEKGQKPVSSINGVFRTRVESISSVSNVTSSCLFSSNIPQTKSEMLSNTPSTSYSIFSDSNLNSNLNSNSPLSLSLISTSIKSDLITLSQSINNNNINNNNNNINNNNSKINSNMLRLKISGSSFSSISTITIILQTLRSESYPVYESDEYVNTSCVENVVSEKVHKCKGELGEVSITHRCNGTMSGLIVSKCPRQSIEAVCHVPNSFESSFNCSKINHTSSTITCKCDRIIFENNNENNNNRKLSSSSSSSSDSKILSDSGVLEVVGISVIVVDSFEETITTTMSASDVKKVIVVILLYGLLWSIGLLGMLLCSIRYGYDKVGGLNVISGKNENKRQSEVKMKKELASLTRSRDDIRQYLLSYVSEILPSVFRPKTGIVRFWEEVSKTHRYLLLFTASGEDGDKKRILTGIHLLTVQTMLMFILAVFYDLQYPQDDGECKTYVTEESCLSPTSVLDSSNNLCRWVSKSSNNNNNNNEYICESEPINMTIKTMVIISIYVSMFTAIINLVVDFLFEDILFAPTMNSRNDESKESKFVVNKIEKYGDKFENKNKFKNKEENKEDEENESNNNENNNNNNTENNNNTTNSNSHEEIEIRQSSSSSLKESEKEEEIEKENNINKNKISKKSMLIKSQSGKFDLETTRVVPSSTQEAHDLAVISMKDIIKDQVLDIKRTTLLQKIRREKSVSLKQKSSLEKYRESLRNRGESIKVKSGANRCMNEVALEEKFIELTVDIMEQRKELKRSQQDGFDEMWGIDPTGEFSKQRQNYLLFWSKSKSSGDIIKKEMKFVDEESKKKIDKLDYSSDVQRGLEILHYFILDLLGRDTPVAKIFLTKTEEDFRHSYVVTKFTKVLAWICVIMLNLFFVYFSILRGLQRGLDWQRLYCIACILQLIIEVAFYETSECAIVNFFIPNLARTEVQGVTFAIYQAIQSICSLSSQSNLPILDAPRYLFLSTRLAERFPDLLESVIVRSYHSYSPGELSRKWRISHYSNSNSISNSLFDSIFDFNSRSRIGSRTRRVTFTTLLVSFLQYIGSTSISIQRFIIHALQPLAVAALTYLFALIYHNPLYLLVIIPLLGYWCYEIWNKWYLEEKSVEDVVVPIEELQNRNNNNNLNKRRNNISNNLNTKDNNNNNNNNSQLHQDLNRNQNNSNNYEKKLNNLNNNNNNIANISKLNEVIESDLDSQSQKKSGSIIESEIEIKSESEMDEKVFKRYLHSDSNDNYNSKGSCSNESQSESQFNDDLSYDDGSFNEIFSDDNISYQHKKKYLQSISSDDVNFEFDSGFEKNSSFAEDD